MEIKTNYLEMTKILSGTNKISICFNSLVAHTLKKYNLSDDSVPLHLLHHTIENFYYNFQISGLVPSFMYTASKYDFIYEYFRQRLNLKFNEKFFNAILVFPVEENVNFINSIFKEGTFVFLMNDMYFEFPFIYAHLLTAPLNTHFVDTKHELNEFDEIIDENILKKINEIYKESEPIFYSVKISDKLKEQMKSVTKEYFYDPHIHYSLVNKLTCPDLTAENLTQNFGKNLHFANKICTSNLSELDYRINVEEKSVKEQQNYASHLKMLSSSLGTDNLFPLSQKEKSEVKTSLKTRKIVEENLKKLRLAEKQKENDFLKLLFDKYQSSTDKYLFFETLKINDTFEEAKRKVVLLKIEFFYNEWLTESRKEKPFEGKKVNCYFNILNYIEKYHSTFLEEFDWSIDILRKLGFESTAHELVEKEKLDTAKYNFKKEATSNDNDISFLLKYYGPYLKRSVDSRKDPRVFFEPDFWQVQLLDLIDENKSVIVSAPTSSGKTFICFYVIHKLLSLTDQIILFILPTKALVNQVTADIYSRFSQRTTKQFLQGQIMQEYSINPFNSQVILTIPSMAEQILLTRKVSYVILDECHLICENESVERILHVVKCPIVMLSATVGNINEFYEQVYEIFKCKSNTLINNLKNNDCNAKHSNINNLKNNNVNNLKNNNVNNLKNNNGNTKKSNFNTKKSNVNNSDDKLIYCIEYKERYCDIKPFVFNNTLIPINTLFAYTYDYIKEYGFTNDLNFLPDEILNLYYSIYHVIKNKSLIHEIRPQKYFKSNLLNKRDVILYENYLLKTVQRWINEKMLSEKEVNKLYYLLTKESREVFEELKKIKPNDTSDDNTKEVYYFTTIDYMLNNISNLCNTLKSKEMLPCIIFNTDRRIVDLLALRLYNELSNLNVSDTRIKDKLLKEKKRTRDVIEKGKDVWKSKSIQEEEEYSLLKEKYEYSFTDEKYKLSDYELKEMTNNIKNTSTIYKNMLKLGIGLHHEGMNKKFRSVIEILFRKKHLQVIFATDTLSLGINMPCKTVVFTNDILYSLAYKQMSGRAGRRGYDLQGNVVFYGVEENKVKNMIISDRNTIITKNIINYVEVIYCTNEFIRESFVNHSMFITKLINYLKKNNSTNNPINNSTNNSTNNTINSTNNSIDNSVNIIDNSINQSNNLSNNSIDLNNNLNNKLGILKKSDVNKSIDLFINKRNDLFNYKRNVLLQLNYLINDNKTYLSDILILNKDKQLECMIMLYLIHSDLIKLDKLSLLEVLVHFFGVIHKVTIKEEKGILPDLPCKEEINHLIYYLNNKPIPHFYWLNLHSKKDDYILQFMFNNIKNDIKVLFKGLKEINDFVKSVICVYERFNVEEEIVKKLVIFIKWFEPKFSNIYS